ncbi:YhzD-like protein [Salinibacillus kushneri]|uniref:YhzD-like protein n=1 Tax=Salinibacillus kushneri TaxID=237682 RepID=A0A1I0AVC0_9BACI|nr:YhzD family protein [Salinibacillus kushneri]SES98358.1 YhzD-like protein [Salinibacillus kushneri]
MGTYYLTVYDKDGTNLLDDTLEAKNDQEAKKIGQQLLEEKGYEEHTHRCVSPNGHLVLFHR